jgi:hypothetical protein
VTRDAALARLAIGHYMLRRWSLEEDVRQLERLGFRAIGLASTKLDAYGPERAIRLMRARASRSRTSAHTASSGPSGMPWRAAWIGCDVPSTGRIGSAPTRSSS